MAFENSEGRRASQLTFRSRCNRGRVDITIDKVLRVKQ